MSPLQISYISQRIQALEAKKKVPPGLTNMESYYLKQYKEMLHGVPDANKFFSASMTMKKTSFSTKPETSIRWLNKSTTPEESPKKSSPSTTVKKKTTVVKKQQPKWEEIDW